MFRNPRWAVAFITMAIVTLVTAPIWAAGPLWDAAGPTVVLAPGGSADVDARQVPFVTPIVLGAPIPSS